ncbi:hypothetical protein ACQPYK_41275 [Streptosporangium sp. CA-135522]|uniref:hypothetical protein n=1 Tax=Streptosporangium sp. CA-135522 TaxID=3240072 RepID=UPI003D8BE7EE
MTSRDAMYGGEKALNPDPNWPGLDGGAAVSEFDTDRMRKLAGELESYIAGMKGPAYSEGYTTGSTESFKPQSMLTEQQLGAWQAASAFAKTVGSSSSEEHGARALGHVYELFVTRLEEVIRAIHANAGEYDGANQANTGGNGKKA